MSRLWGALAHSGIDPEEITSNTRQKAESRMTVVERKIGSDDDADCVGVPVSVLGCGANPG
jgi:hypothetical protein